MSAFKETVGGCVRQVAVEAASQVLVVAFSSPVATSKDAPGVGLNPCRDLREEAVPPNDGRGWVPKVPVWLKISGVMRGVVDGGIGFSLTTNSPYLGRRE